MSNNKTVVPGMGNSFGFGGSSNQNGQFSNNQQPAQGYNGTHFPGMDAGVRGGTMAATETHKPVMGFLYSVSRTACGEYWPLYMGLNTIGRSTTCSVRLSEATISDNHAEIVIRQMKNPDSVLVSIQDARSTCGTLLNGSSLGFDAQECHNGDIITIGEHYELYFVLIDTKALGLDVRTDFIPTGAALGGGQMPMNPMGGPAGVTIPFGQSQTPQPAPAPQFTQVAGGNANAGFQQQRSSSTVIMPGLKK